MPLVLRVDVDKPYGNSNFYNSVRSKLSEDYWYPNFSLFKYNYLAQLDEFLNYCNKVSIKGYFYFRICTIPDENIKKLLKNGGHKAGMHAENTRNYDTFKNEYEKLLDLSNIKLDSFSKHGSGKIKLGKHHYAPYEPDKYIEWAKKLNISFPFGNDICSCAEDLKITDDYYPKIFWIEREYRNEHFKNLSKLIEVAKKEIVPILIHPSNFNSTAAVRNDFKELIQLAKEHNIDWVLL